MSQIKYTLSPNNLKTAEKNSYLAKVQSYGCVDFERIVNRICYRGSGITDSEAIAVLTELTRAIEDALSDGYTVSLPFVNIKPSIRGQFNGEDDYFMPQRHKLCFTVSPGKTLKELPKKIRMKKIHTRPKCPHISELINRKDDKELKELVPFDVIEIRGSNFVFPEDDKEVGVYVESKTEQVKADILNSNNSSTILVMLPKELPTGELHLRIIVRHQNHTKLMSCVSLSFQPTNTSNEMV
jgi:hypothetical protein